MIRTATIADIPWLIDAGAMAQAESPWYGPLPTNHPEQYKRLVRIMQLPDHVCIRVVDDESGFICGALEPAVWFETTYAIQNLLYVKPAFRGTSRAWRLVAAFEAWARERGASRVLNGVSSGINEELVGRFYEKMGYLPMGQSYYKELT